MLWDTIGDHIHGLGCGVAYSTKSCTSRIVVYFDIYQLIDYEILELGKLGQFWAFQ